MRKFALNNIGQISHSDADNLMRVMQAKRIEDEIIDTLIVCEHDEIVTVGPRARNDGISPPPTFPTSPVDRGGGLTWHGPGQLVIYPIFKWNMEGESNVKAIISILENWVIKSLQDNGINAVRDNRMQGVWVGKNKICSIGSSISSSVASMPPDNSVSSVRSIAAVNVQRRSGTMLTLPLFATPS